MTKAVQDMVGNLCDWLYWRNYYGNVCIASLCEWFENGTDERLMWSHWELMLYEFELDRNNQKYLFH